MNMFLVSWHVLKLYSCMFVNICLHAYLYLMLIVNSSLNRSKLAFEINWNLIYRNIPQDGSKYPRFVSCSVMIQCINHEFDDIILNFKFFLKKFIDEWPFTYINAYSLSLDNYFMPNVNHFQIVMIVHVVWMFVIFRSKKFFKFCIHDCVHRIHAHVYLLYNFFSKSVLYDRVHKAHAYAQLSFSILKVHEDIPVCTNTCTHVITFVKEI